MIQVPSKADPQTSSAAAAEGMVTRSACCRHGAAYRNEHARLIEGSGGGSDSEATFDGGGTWADVLSLPPLPERDYCAMRGEACCGNTLVLFLIFLFVAPMQAYATGKDVELTFPQRLWMGAIYAEAATAIVCLLGLMWGNPGEVKRTPETCFPQPEIVAERLRKGQSLHDVGNVTEDGRVFCIRCLVWRPDDDGEVHHCATCQRCVTQFDHHCGVFGRCIAGNGYGGNMGYFKTIIGMAIAGCVRGPPLELRAAPPRTRGLSDRGGRSRHLVPSSPPCRPPRRKGTAAQTERELAPQGAGTALYD